MDGHYDVIIIGAGLSGLTAAKELSDKFAEGGEKGVGRILLLEANGRIGGRLQAVQLETAAGAATFDIGGQWVGRTQAHMLRLLDALQLHTYDQHVTGTKLGQFGCATIRPYSEQLPVGQLQHYSMLEGFDMARTILFLEHSVAQVDNVLDAHMSWNGAAQADRISVAEAVAQLTYTRAATDAVDIATRVSMGCNSHKLSHLYLTLYGKMAGGLMNLLSSEYNAGAQALKIKGGAFQVCTMLEEQCVKAGNVDIMLNQVVSEVQHNSDAYCKVVAMDKTDDSDAQLRSFTCEHVIAALAPSQNAKITFSPALPEAKVRLFQSMPMGNLVKFVVTYTEAFWRAKGLSGEIISTGLTENLGERKPILVTFDACTPGGTAALAGFIHNEYSDMAAAQRERLVIEDLVRFFGPESREYTDYKDKSWHCEPYVGGCPVGILSTGCGELLHSIRDIVNGRVHFAGTECATQWAGYMDGAVQAGLRAAHEVLHTVQPHAVNEHYLEGSQLSANYKVPTALDYSYKTSTSGFRFWSFACLGMSAILMGFYVYKKTR